MSTNIIENKKGIYEFLGVIELDDEGKKSSTEEHENLHRCSKFDLQMSGHIKIVWIVWKCIWNACLWRMTLYVKYIVIDIYIVKYTIN